MLQTWGKKIIIGRQALISRCCITCYVDVDHVIKIIRKQMITSGTVREVKTGWAFDYRL